MSHQRSVVLEHLHAHRSIRRYRADAEIPDADLRAAVAAGQAASTSSAVQSYSVIRVRDAGTRTRLAELAGGQAQVAEAGCLLIVCGDVRRHRLCVADAGGTYDARLEAFLLAAIDAALFAQNLSVALEAMGHGICYIGGLRNELAEVDRLLALPEGVYPFYGLVAGVPDEPPPLARPRLPLDAVLHEERYTDDETMRGHLAAYDEAYRAYLEDRGARSLATWTQRMGAKFARPERTHLAGYYQGKGARLD